MLSSEAADTPKPPAAPEVRLFTLEILKVIKNAQQQHGLRHGDFQRYRGYCSRRIRRLRKVLKIPQGDRRHFKRRDVTETHITDKKADQRYLEIPLMLAERCWAYAMQLRQESNTEQRKKFHLVQKLRKASVYALQLEELCQQERCDARTKLEAQAYVAWIQGTLQFELKIWLKATENLKKAQMIYEKMAGTLPEADQGAYQQRVVEITPSLRYCAYNIGDEKVVDLLELRSQGILEGFDALLSQTKKETNAVLHEIEWFGLKIPVHNERVRLFLVSIEGLDESLVHAENNQARIKLLENLFIDLRDVISLVRSEKQDPLLLSYLLSIRVERSSQRHLLLIQQTRKPQDCVRLLDIILQQTSELSQNEALRDLEAAQTHFQQQLDAYKALRVYYLGKTQAAQKRFQEAAILLDASAKALLTYRRSGTGNIEELDALVKSVREMIDVDRIGAQANYVLDLPEGLAVPQRVHKSKKPLIERLDEFREEPQLLTKNPNLVTLPPAMVPVPAKPLFFDLALNFVQLPDLTDRLEGGDKQKGAGISGFVKGLWGWGSKK